MTEQDMGSYFQSIVDRDASDEDAPELAERIEKWLISRHIIKSELSACALGKPGHRPGRAHSKALANPALNALGLEKNGVQLQVGRTVFWTHFKNLTCGACRERFEPGEEWSDAADEWDDGDDDVIAPAHGWPALRRWLGGAW